MTPFSIGGRSFVRHADLMGGSEFIDMMLKHVTDPAQIEEYRALKMEGHWPPSAFLKTRLHTLAEHLTALEKKHGLSFANPVSLTPGPAPMVQGNGTLHIGIEALHDDDEGLSALEGLLHHELAHVKNGDIPRYAGACGLRDAAQQMATLKTFHEDDPERFLGFVAEHYPSYREFRNDVAEVCESYRSALPGLPLHMDDKTLARGMERHGLAERIDANLSRFDMGALYPAIIRLTAALGGQSPREQQAISTFLAAQSKTIEDMPYHAARQPEANPQTLKAVQTEAHSLQMPWHEAEHDAAQLSSFASALSRAAEYRADRLALSHANEPMNLLRYLKSVEPLIDRAKAEALTRGAEQIETHPSVTDRVDAGRRFLATSRPDTLPAAGNFCDRVLGREPGGLPSH